MPENFLKPSVTPPTENISGENGGDEYGVFLQSPVQGNSESQSDSIPSLELFPAESSHWTLGSLMEASFENPTNEQADFDGMPAVQLNTADANAMIPDDSFTACIEASRLRMQESFDVPENQVMTFQGSIEPRELFQPAFFSRRLTRNQAAIADHFMAPFLFSPDKKMVWVKSGTAERLSDQRVDVKKLRDKKKKKNGQMSGCLESGIRVELIRESALRVRKSRKRAGKVCVKFGT